MSLLGIEQLSTTIALALSIICFALIIFRSISEEQRIAISYTVFSIITCFGYCQVLYSNGILDMLIFATKLKYLGTLSMALSLILVFRYFKVKIPHWILIIICVLLVFLFLMIFGFDSPSKFSLENPHSWLYFCKTWLFKSYRAVVIDGIPYLKKQNAWGHALFILVCGLYALSMTVLFVSGGIKNKSSDVGNLFLLYLIFIIPSLCYLIEKIIIKVFGFESIPIVPIGIVISDIIFVYLIEARKFFDINIIANNIMFDVVNMPIFVIDKKYRLTNINNAASEVFVEWNLKNMIGKNVFFVFPRDLASAIKEMIELGYSVKSNETLMETIQNESSKNNHFIFYNDKVFQPKLCKIVSSSNLSGYVVWLEDVTLLNSYKDRLESEIMQKTAEISVKEGLLKLMRDQMVLGFASLAEHHDSSCKGHLHRTASYTRAIADELLREHLFSNQIDDNFVQRMYQVAPLHDIGKSYIDKEIFDKPNSLNAEEAKLMKMHTVLGAKFIYSIMKDNVEPEYFKMAHDVALYHHEWWDGSGYPEGLKGEEIPLCARIMAIADNYDALVTKRPYKKPFSSEEAYGIIQKAAGVHFDPSIVNAFVNIRQEIEAIKNAIDNLDTSLEI